MDARVLALVGAGVLAGALGPASAAKAAQVTVGARCYAEGDEISLNGSGFRPGAAVVLGLSRSGGALLRFATTPVADAAGRVSGTYGVEDETGWFAREEWRFRMTLTLAERDRPRVRSSARFWFSRWDVVVRTPGGRLRPRRPAVFEATGFTGSSGKVLYAHWVRGSVRRHTRRLGVLEGPCATLRARVDRGFPFAPVLPGTWHVAFNTSPRDPRAPGTIVQRAVAGSA
jgi:hypothetical protein